MKIKVIFLLLILIVLISADNKLNAQSGSVTPSLRPGHSYVPGQLSVMLIDGPAFYSNPIERKWHRIRQGQTIKPDDSVRTESHGYLLLAWGAENMIMIKPHSGIRIEISNPPQIKLHLHSGEILVSSRNSAEVSVIAKNGVLQTPNGEMSISADQYGETIRSLMGEAYFRLNGSATPTRIPENYSMHVDADGREGTLKMFDPATEYESFRRFSKWLKKFDFLHNMYSTDLNFKVDSVKINDRFISNLPISDNQFIILETDNGKIQNRIHLQLKITPYPAPTDRFEISLGKDLVYALRDGRDGYLEAVFSPPSIPEFLLTVSRVDLQNRRISIFKQGFTVENMRLREQRARQFCENLSLAMSRRDQAWLRKHVSKDYRDWQGNTWYDFFNMMDDTLRKFRDVRLTLHPFRFEVRDGQTIIHLNYRLSALTSDWRYRFEDRGSDIFTLKMEDENLKLSSKTAGLFFNRLKVAVNFRHGVIKGRITDERTGMPVSGVSVTLPGTNYRALTDSMGEYVIYNVIPGDYDIKYFKNGFGELTATRVKVNPAGEQF